MSKKRVIIAALLFLAATCVKFALPSYGASLCVGLEALMSRGMEMREAAAVLGERVAAFGQKEESVIEADAQDAGTQNEKLTAVSVPAPTFQTPLQTVSLLQTGIAPTAEDIERCAAELEQREQREQKQQLVEAFLEAQSVFAGCDIPEDVCCAVPELAIDYASPISGVLSSGFGFRVHPVSGEIKFHYGTDLAADAGAEICCFAAGTVTAVGEESGYGKYVTVSHGSCTSLYAHCSVIEVSAGDTVSMGQVIARVGQTGLATGPHLHFELRQDGMYLDPEFYCGAEG